MNRLVGLTRVRCPLVAVGLFLRDAFGRLFLLLLGGLGLLVHRGRLSLRCVSELDGWRLCPRCGAELERGEGRVRCTACSFIFYASSKPTASAVIAGDDERLLLSRRASEPFAGKWDLPGGFLEEREHPLDCLRRELREEAGIEFSAERFLGAWIDRYGHGPNAVATLNLYWSVSVAAGTPEAADDVAELRWFAADEVPEDELAFEHIWEVLSAWRNEDT